MSDDDVPTLVFEGPYAEVLFVKTLIESAGIATSITDQMRGGVSAFIRGSSSGARMPSTLVRSSLTSARTVTETPTSEAALVSGTW